jgi:cell division protein FtsQ
MAVTAPADKRFRRVQVKPSRRRAAHSAWRRVAFAAVLITLSAYAANQLVVVVTGLAVLRVEQINVRGNHRLSNGEVLALLHGLRGRSVLTVDLEEWRKVLTTSPWVADAFLRRSLPSTIDVTILERSPIGIGRMNGALYLIDERGMVIDEYGPGYRDLDLPIIDGMSPSAGEASNLYRAVLVSRLLESLRMRNLAGHVSQVDVSDSRNAVILLEGDTTLIRLGNERFAERLQSYLELAPTLRERVPVIDYVDLRFDERVYVRPAQRQTRNRQTDVRQGANRREALSEQ